MLAVEVGVVCELELPEIKCQEFIIDPWFECQTSYFPSTECVPYEANDCNNKDTLQRILYNIDIDSKHTVKLRSIPIWARMCILCRAEMSEIGNKSAESFPNPNPKAGFGFNLKAQKLPRMINGLKIWTCCVWKALVRSFWWLSL